MSDILTPCCGGRLIILTRSEGPAYLTFEVPDEIICTGSGCGNSWDENGVASEWNE